MTKTDAPWVAELPHLEGELRAHVRQIAPALDSEHDDFVNDALASLSIFLARLTEKPHPRSSSEEFPSRWFIANGRLTDEDRARLGGLSRLMLHRRMADYFRASSRWRKVSEKLATEPISGDDRDQELLVQRALAVTLDFIATLPASDRALLLDEQAGASPRRDNERQRLSRLRVRLRRELSLALGDAARYVINFGKKRKDGNG